MRFVNTPIGLSYVADLVEAGVVEPPEPFQADVAVDLLRSLPNVLLSSLVAGAGASVQQREAARGELLKAAQRGDDAKAGKLLDQLLALPDVVTLASLRPTADVIGQLTGTVRDAGADEADGDCSSEYAPQSLHERIAQLELTVGRLASTVSSGFLVAGVLTAVSTMGILVTVAWLSSHCAALFLERGRSAF